MSTNSPAPSEADREQLREIHAALTRGDVEGAEALAARALAGGVEHPMVLSLAAGRLEKAGRVQDALPLLVRAKRAAPQAAGIRNALGLCLDRCGRPGEALAEFASALALDPRIAPAHANRAGLLTRLGRLEEARSDYESAIALDPAQPLALAGLAALAIQRGDAAEAEELAKRALALAPDMPDPATTLAAAEVAQGRAAEGEARLRQLLADPRLQPMQKALALGVLGDAIDAQRRHGEAFAAYASANRVQQDLYRRDFAGRQTTLSLLRELTAFLADRRFSRPPREPAPGPAARHVFLVGFPRSGTTLLEQALEQHPDVTTLSEKECMVDSAAVAMTSAPRFDAFSRLPEERLEPYRAAYWKRVAAEGAAVAGKVFVDKHPFHTFKLPLIAKLFPEARILFARRDPRDTVLSCFRQRFTMNDPNFQMLTLEGTAQLYAATMEFAAASEAAFGLETLPCPLEAIVADFDGETRRICAHIGIEWNAAMRDFAERVRGRGVFTPSAAQLARGLNAGGVGRWRDYEAQMAPVLPLLQPWVERFGYG